MAESEWAPGVSVEIVQVAVPAESATLVQLGMVAGSSRKLTLPVGAPALPLTVTVIVTACPLLDGLGELVRTTLAAAFAGCAILTASVPEGPDGGSVRPTEYTEP